MNERKEKPFFSLKEIKHEFSKPVPPEYDPAIPPVCDINDIMKKLPHRPPFLLVDRITYLDEWTVCGIKMSP